MAGIIAAGAIAASDRRRTRSQEDLRVCNSPSWIRQSSPSTLISCDSDDFYLAGHCGLPVRASSQGDFDCMVDGMVFDRDIFQQIANDEAWNPSRSRIESDLPAQLVKDSAIHDSVVKPTRKGHNHQSCTGCSMM